VSTHETLALDVLFAVGFLMFLWAAPVRAPWARGAVVLVLVALTGNYAWWRARNMPPLHAGFSSLWPWTFLAFEALALLYEVWSWLVMLRKSDHTPAADRYEARLRARPDDLPTVDVFVATYEESLEILQMTIAALGRLDYPADRVNVYVLDDGGTASRCNSSNPATHEKARARARRLRALCTANGVHYLTRENNKHFKAGNLRSAFEQTRGEFILMLDADFAVEPNILYRTLGFLVYRRDVGLVQTPQQFRNADVIGYNLRAADAVPEEQHFFMTVTQPCRDAWDNAFCVGTGCVVSRRALEAIGGYPRNTICEDLELSYALRSAGYRTLFLSEPLAHGLAPEAIPEYLKQRVRWCAGTVQQLYIRTGPVRGRHRLLDRLFYFEGLLYWLGFVFVVLLLLAPIVFWFTGVSVITGTLEGALAVLLPRLVARALGIYWLSEGAVPPVVINVSKVLPAFHVTATILRSLVRPFAATFKVTDKGRTDGRTVIHWRLVLGFTALAALSFGGMWVNLTGLSDLVPVSDMTPLNVAWTSFSTLVCLATALACVEPPRGKEYLSTEPGVRRSKPLKIVTALGCRLVGLR
jgi:cellulose synthase (UDP-forming)